MQNSFLQNRTHALCRNFLLERQSIRHRSRNAYRAISVLLLSLFVLVGCASYGHRVSPVLIPGTQPEYVELKGVEMLAVAFLDK
ncbi:MAG: hypothetical protein ACTSQ8_22385, partial [Candidatus Helarchaeota archaeon]